MVIVLRVGANETKGCGDAYLKSLVHSLVGSHTGFDVDNVLIERDSDE